MKYRQHSVPFWLVASCSFLFCPVFGQETATETGFEVFQHGDVERQYVLHLPEDLPENAPLVFFLHGYHGNARNYAKMGMSRVADKHGFAVVYPQGKPDRRDVPHWNARLNISDIDDVGFLTALAKDLQHTHDFGGAILHKICPRTSFAQGLFSCASLHRYHRSSCSHATSSMQKVCN